jgi:TRAP-type C4-dicarboxylate transport system permease small subunit
MAASDRTVGLLGSARRVLERLSTAAALVGGTLLSGAAVFVAVAVVSAGFGRPILGDSEVVELAAGIAVASFMPLCQINHGHVAITTFTDAAPRWLRNGLDTLAAALVAVVVIVLTWRLLDGGILSYSRNRTSMFLQVPQWWGFAAAAGPMVLWSVNAVFVLVERLAGVEPEAWEQRT